MYLFDQYNASPAMSAIIIIIWIKEKYQGFKTCGKGVYWRRLYREGWFFCNWTFNNAPVPWRVNIHLEFWHLVCTNSCSDGRPKISTGQWFPNSKTSGFVFIVNSILFFINELSADFLIYVSLITSTSSCNF